MKRIGKLYNKTVLDGLHWEINKLRNHELITVHTDTDHIVIKDMQNHSVTPDEPLESLPKWVKFSTTGTNTVSLNGDAASSKILEYSYDGISWSSWTDPTSALTFSGGTDLYVRGSGNTSFENAKVVFGNTTDLVDVEGNIMSLLDYSGDFNTIPSNYCFSGFFSSCQALRTVSSDFLPATTLAEYCYNGMFSSCSSLTTAPVLPAPTLVYYCYNSMFMLCSSLNNIVCLCENMSSLTAENYVSNWVLYGPSANGTFTKKAGTVWKSGASGIPSNWTIIDV